MTKRLTRRSFLSSAAAIGATLPFIKASTLPAMAATGDLPGPEEAKINWRQFEGTKLRFLGGLHPASANINAIAPEFEKLTGINLTVEQIAWDAYSQKVQLDLGSPQPQYDMFLCNGGDFDWAYGPSGNLSEVQQFIDDPALTDQAWYDLGDVDPKIITAASWDGVPDHREGTGKPHVIPFMSESFMLAYRDDILQKHSVKPPTTLEELLPAAKAVFDGEGGSLPAFSSRGDTDGGICNAVLINLLPNYGVSDFDDSGNSQLATDASVRVHDLLIKQIIKPLGPKSWIGTDWDTARRRFAQGESAMFFDADWFAGLYEDPAQSQVAGKVKYLNFGSADSKYVDYYYFGAAINDHSPNKKAAWLAAQYITSKKVMRDSAVNNRLLMPTRLSTFNDPQFVKMAGAWGDGTWITAAKANLNKWSRAAILPNDQYDQVKTVWAGAVAKMYEGAVAKDALTDAVSQIDEIMDRGGYRKG